MSACARGRVGNHQDFSRARVQTHASEYVHSYSLLSDAFFMFKFAHFLYIHTTHVFLNRHTVHSFAEIFSFIFDSESLCSADFFSLGREWSLTSGLICESYLNEHMYGSEVHFLFCVIASLKHFVRIDPQLEIIHWISNITMHRYLQNNQTATVVYLLYEKAAFCSLSSSQIQWTLKKIICSILFATYWERCIHITGCTVDNLWLYCEGLTQTEMREWIQAVLLELGAVQGFTESTWLLWWPVRQRKGFWDAVWRCLLSPSVIHSAPKIFCKSSTLCFKDMLHP